jgi:hypothetical protein
MRERVVAIVLAAAAVLGAPATAFGQAEHPTYVGRPVADVLKALQATSLKLIFSSELVPASLRVTKEPTAVEPRDIALQILEPHGLTLREAPGGIYIVVKRRQAPETRNPEPTGSGPSEPVRTTDEKRPLRIEERVDVTEAPRTPEGSRGYSVEPRAVQEMAGGLENVIQSLAVLPGVAAVNDDDGRLAVRGAGPEHNMVVLDGVQIHNVQRLGEWTTSFLNPATASAITLDPSGLDARFGGRLSSVVNLETRDGRTDRRLAASGSVGLTSGDVLLEGRMPGTRTGSWWATLRGTHYRLVRDRFEDSVMPSFADLQAKATLRPSANTRLTLFGLAGRETLKQLDFGVTPEPFVFESTRGENRIGAGTLRWTPSSRVSSVTTLSAYAHDSQDTDRVSEDDVPFPNVDPFRRRVVLHDYAVRHQLLWAWSPGRTVDTGVDLHRVTSSWQMAGVRPPDWWRGVGPTTAGELIDYANGPIDSRLERTQAGAWVQLGFEAGRAATIEPGIRVDWNSYTGEASWQPRLRVSRAFGTTSVWAGISWQAQTPSHESLQGFQYFELPEDGSDLRNERTRQIVAGVERPLGAGFDVRAEVYVRSFDRLLVQRLETDEERANRLAQYVIPPDLPADAVILEHRPTVFPVSTGTGQATGLELLVRRSRGRVTGWTAYTLASSTRDLYGYTVPSDFDRRHTLNTILEAAITRRVRAAMTWQMASGFPATPVLEEVSFYQTVGVNGVVDPIYRASRLRDGRLGTTLDFFTRRLATMNSERLSGYQRADVRGTYSTLGHWEFYGEVLNLFNNLNQEQTIRDPIGAGLTNSFKTRVYSTFERMFAYGVRVKF